MLFELAASIHREGITLADSPAAYCPTRNSKHPSVSNHLIAAMLTTCQEVFRRSRLTNVSDSNQASHAPPMSVMRSCSCSSIPSQTTVQKKKEEPRYDSPLIFICPPNIFCIASIQLKMFQPAFGFLAVNSMYALVSAWRLLYG